MGMGMGASAPYWEDVEVGMRLPEIRVDPLTRSDFVRYAGASGDFNPIHHDETFARAAGNPTVFAMGMLAAGVLTRAATAFAGRPAIRRYTVRFVTRAWPGDEVICTGTVSRKFVDAGEHRIEAELRAANQKGEALIEGRVVAALPSRGA